MHHESGSIGKRQELPPKNKRDLWSHQQKTLEAVFERAFFAIFDEVGTGKTRTAVEIYQQKCQQHARPLKALILCPVSVRGNWQKEFQDAGVLTNVLTGSGREKAAALTQPDPHRDTPIKILNHEALANRHIAKAVETFAPDFLIVDESHRFKSKEAKRTLSLMQLAKGIQYRFILTGSPILQSALDIWAQFQIMHQGILPNNFFTFRGQYFYDANANMPADRHFPNWKMRRDREVCLTELISEHSHRRKKTDILDLPPLIRQTNYIDLMPEQARHYRELERTFKTTIRAREISVDLVITQMLRLSQICSGVLASTEQEYSIPCGKRTALMELLETITTDHKVIVWSCWRATYPQIESACTELGIKHVSVTGQTAPDDRQTAITEFNTNPEVRVFIGNQRAGGVGINLQAASYCIYYSKNYSLEDDLQSEARNYRGGSEIHQKITRIDLVTKDTIEEQITEALCKKQKMADMLLTLKKMYCS